MKGKKGTFHYAQKRNTHFLLHTHTGCITPPPPPSTCRESGWSFRTDSWRMVACNMTSLKLQREVWWREKAWWWRWESISCPNCASGKLFWKRFDKFLSIRLNQHPSEEWRKPFWNNFVKALYAIEMIVVSQSKYWTFIAILLKFRMMKELKSLYIFRINVIQFSNYDKLQNASWILPYFLIIKT